MLTVEELNENVSNKDRLDVFRTNMENCLKDAGRDSIEEYELMFIPILHAKHFYVMCFNMKSAKVEVLDNLGGDEEFDSKQPPIMQHTLSDYLAEIQHPIAETLRSSKRTRLKMGWRTLNNIVDCGMFAMRHMETYKGKQLKN
ncbi:uncharacterized protein LOC143569345 [Bidens hawaiensis]|uniref:uncharacterized protein LOC143569345 n=1 Tax=Bidens hawaiensis TaxID=980011 RepID=UPI00404ACFD0